MAIEYRVLGSFEVRRGATPVELGSHRQRALLAFLTMRPLTCSIVSSPAMSPV